LGTLTTSSNEGSAIGRDDPVSIRKQVTAITYDGPINELGMRLSQLYNFYNDQWKNYIDNSDVKADLDYVGLTPREGVIYSVDKDLGAVRLTVGTNHHDYIMQESDLFHVPIVYLRYAKLEEEKRHILESLDKDIKSIGDLVAEEKRTKEGVFSHYKKLRDNTKGPVMRDVYERILESIEHDIDTVDIRYRKTEKFTSKRKSRNKSLESRIMQEAYALGLDPDEVEDYVAKRMEDMDDDEEMKDSELEARAEEESEIPIKKKKDNGYDSDDDIDYESRENDEDEDSEAELEAA